jgi:hypothetical protein
MPSHSDSVHMFFFNGHFNTQCTLQCAFHMWPSCLADFQNKNLYGFLVRPPTRELHYYWRQTVKQNHMAALRGTILLFIRGFTNIDLHTVIEQGTTNTVQAPLQLGGQKFKLWDLSSAGYYAASSNNPLSTFRYSLSAPSLPLKTGRCIIPRKIADLIYFAAEACNHGI